MISQIDFILQILSIIALSLPAFMILAEIIGPLPGDTEEPEQRKVIYGIYLAFLLLLLNGILIVGWVTMTNFSWLSMPSVAATLLILAFASIIWGLVVFYKHN